MKDIEFKPPLAIFFVWHPSDSVSVDPILSAIRKSFARDRRAPFSRGLNIPLFFFSSKDSKQVPENYPNLCAIRNIIFVFTSVNTTGNTNWLHYISNLPSLPSTNIVPIAIDGYGLSHKGSLHGINCIRSYDWPEENKDLRAVVALAHEIFRFGFSDLLPDEPGKRSSIKIFLSHAKAGDTGRIYSEAIKKFIADTNMESFFDANEISPGFQFNEEIEKHIPQSTLLAIESDAYSSRYWCQREILSAKQHNRPVVVLNCLEDYEDRIFPAASNVPRIHVSASETLSSTDILRVLVATILETVRHNYALRSLENYKSQGWIDDDCELISRPPEIRQVLLAKSKGKQKICYPEPPIYSDEADWHKALEVDCFTPLWSNSEENTLKDVRIGVSISENKNIDYSANHLHPDSLIRLSQDLSRHLLSRSSTILYGGDLRADGFSEFILDEALILKERLQHAQLQIENHLAWPLHISDTKILAWRAKYHDVMFTKEHEAPKDISFGLSHEVFSQSNTPESQYIWARCLTHMREESISSSQARVCAGGKLSGYKGIMPGVLEEVLISFEMNKPIFLLGGFGGVVGEIAKVILGGSEPETLTEDWQLSNNSNYSDLQKIAKKNNYSCNFRLIMDKVRKISIKELSELTGLQIPEYERLLISPFIDECVHLITKGLKNLKNS